MRHIAILLVVISLTLLGFPRPVEAQAQHDHSQHAQPGAASPQAAPPPAKVDKRPAFFRGKGFSEFNHRVAGLFVVLTGVFYFFSDRIGRRWPRARYAWPLCLFIPGLYLLFLSDPKWPFGPKSFFELVQTNREFMQHKVFSVLLIALGGFEFARIRGTIRGAWSAFVFPALGLGGALLLLAHPHGAGVHTPEHMAAMGKIQNQHLWFTIVGTLIALSKGLSEIPWMASRFFLRAWPALMMVLGVLLLVYSE